MRALVVASLYPNPASPTRGLFVRDRIVHLARRGVDVRVVAPIPSPFGRRPFRAGPERETRDGIPVAHPSFVVVPGVGAPIHGWTYLRALERAERGAGAPTPDVVDAHYLYPDGYAAVRFARRRRLPVVVSARGTDVNVIADDPLLGPFVRYTLRRATRIVTVSDDLRRKVLRLGVEADRVRSVPNGVDAERFRVREKAAARRALDFPERATLIVSVGNLVRNKGHHHVLRALASLPSPRSEAHLWILGEGPARGELERLTSALRLGNRVRLLGSRPPEALPEYYAAADLFCLGTEREGWPNAVVEALACGLPVVATRTGGIPELVRDGENGILVDRPERGMAAALDRALARDWDRERISAGARRRTWDQVAQEVNAVLQDACDDVAGRGFEGRASG